MTCETRGAIRGGKEGGGEMKTLMMWVILIVVSVGVFLVFSKISVLTEAFDEKVSHWGTDLAFVFLGGHLAILRLIAFLKKIF